MRAALLALPLALTALALEAGYVGGGAIAQQPGTAAQKRACTPDVYRLCAGEIPNVRKITSCLRANMSRLSPDCRSVFAGELR
jgi:hypothetical protein